MDDYLDQLQGKLEEGGLKEEEKYPTIKMVQREDVQ